MSAGAAEGLAEISGRKTDRGTETWVRVEQEVEQWEPLGRTQWQRNQVKLEVNWEITPASRPTALNYTHVSTCLIKPQMEPQSPAIITCGRQTLFWVKGSRELEIKMIVNHGNWQPAQQLQQKEELTFYMASIKQRKQTRKGLRIWLSKPTAVPELFPPKRKFLSTLPPIWGYGDNSHWINHAS